jgi:hypothetical protein
MGSIISLRYLRQQISTAISRITPFHGYYPWANRTRFPELNQEAIELQSLVTKGLSNGFPSVSAGTGDSRVVRHINRDPSKILMFGSDRLERRGDPFYVSRSGLKNHIFEFCQLREK